MGKLGWGSNFHNYYNFKKLLLCWYLLNTLKISIIRILVNFKGIIFLIRLFFSVVFVIIVLSPSPIVPERSIYPYLNIVLNYMSDFRELCFIKTMRNVIYCLKVCVLTDI